MALSRLRKQLRRKVVFIALMPLATVAAGIMVAAPAQAAPRNCHGSGWDCYFIDINYQPTGNDWVANFAGGNSYWGNFYSPNLYCSPAYSWNDCASSGQSYMTSTMRLYIDANCSGYVLPFAGGARIPNLGNTAWGNFNDNISSDKVGSTC
jgi:hypothetical protein